MSKRKKAVPLRHSETFPHLEFSFGGRVLSKDELKASKRVSFKLCSSDDSNLNDSEYYNKSKKKKIYKTPPASSIILGELSFPINGDHQMSFELNNADYCILVQDTEEFLELNLKISLDSDKKIHVFNLSITNDLLLKTINELLKHKYIWVITNEISLLSGVLNVNITTTPEKTPISKAENLVQLLLGKPLSISSNRNCCSKKGFIKEFFEEIKAHQKDKLNFSGTDVQHVQLIPELRPYQAKAVQWMIFRECNELHIQEAEWLPSIIDTFKLKCGNNIYYNKYTTMLSLQLGNFPPFPKGGILADEMGLGKTVVVISLILNHKPKSELDSRNEVLLPYATEGVQSKIVFKSHEAVKYNNEIVAKNKETYLDPDEKLICNKVSRGPALKKALTEWYESKLAEYSAASPSKIRRIDNDNIKCICGNISSKRKEECVRCPDCGRFQHSRCVGFNKKFLYYCPPCWSKQKLVVSNATLIIAPSSIYHQWFEEISKHVKPDAFQNGVFMYNGLKDGFIQPSVLAGNDIVIATYATLRAEINHAMQSMSERKLRNEERFLKMCSPLIQIYWWRLCLDEAQMVENDHSQINQMVNLISAVNRWSVTGTPIQKSINELYYLVEWLGVEPFVEKSIWDNLLYQPYLNGNKNPLYSVVSKIFWRSSKEDVADELKLPNQKVQYHFLKFTAIEQNFYMREHNLSSSDFSERLKRIGLDLHQTVDSLDKTTLNRLLAPLLNLRQACSHPMAVKGSKIYSKTGNMTLTELLEYLFGKTKVECEEAMRQHIAALNGLAGIHSILEEWETSVDYYRQVLQFTEEYKDKIHIDSLQRIHTLTNLAEILQYHSQGIAPTIRDDYLKNDAKVLEDKYMQNAISELNSDENLLKSLTTKVSELEEKFETASGIWWNRLIHLLTIDGSINELKDKLELELFTSEVENKKQVELFLSKISSVKGIEIMLRNWLGGIEENRSKTLKHLDIIRKKPCEELVYAAVDCHLRTLAIETKKKKCQLCICESVLLDYECSLFDVSRKVLKESYEKVLDGAQTKGSWRAQKAEKCLRALLNVCKLKGNMEAWCLKDGKTHMQLLEAMKKEFKQLRAVWMSLNHQVQALDEISMCKLRLRLRLPGEPIPPKMTNLSLKTQNKIESIFIIERHEVEPQKLKLRGDLELSKSEFKKKYGTLLYLKNLGQKENPKPEPCPVCKIVLENEWCVLQCGHSYCIDCIRIMLNRSPKPSLSCPVCREITKSCDLSFIDLSGKQENSDITVAGDHSTKVDGIVRSLLILKRDDPKVKVLVFSTWAVVLKILEVALTQNGISFRRMPGHDYQSHLKQFKDPNLNVTVLLLPISWGSKGLNLTESNHVFLVEPIMNPAEELQAIGRVHRIGQTKETVVHRFLIKGTIEEKIHTAVSEAKDKWGQKKVTLEDLKNLFDMKNNYLTPSSCEKSVSVS